MPDPAPGSPRARVRFQRKETEQVHVCLGAPGLPRDDDRRFALRVLDAIFGGLSSSRLFQAVREERGLAYAVYSFPASSPTRARSASTSARGPTTSPRRWRSSASELERLRERAAHRGGAGAGARERQGARRARPGVGGGAHEPPRRARSLYGLPLLEVDEIMARIDAVTLDDLRELVDELWAPERLSAAGIGPDEDAFRDAVAPRLPGRGAARGVTRVAVAGAAGRMGQAVCAAVEGADDLALAGRADPALGRRAGGRARRLPTSSSTSRGPDQALANARACLAAGRARRDRDDRLRPRRAARGGARALARTRSSPRTSRSARC